MSSDMNSEKPEFNWGSIEVGMVAGEREITLTPERVAAHLEGVEAGRDWYETGSPFGAPIAPPMIFINDVLEIIDENFRRFGTIHAKSGYRFHRPARIGERVHQKVVFKDLYVKRGKGWMMCEMTVTGEDGEPVVTYLHTSVLSLTRKQSEFEPKSALKQEEEK